MSDPTLCMFTLIPIPIVIVVYLLTKKGLKRAFELNQSAISETTNHLEACFSGIRISLAVAKGLEISKKVQLYGYNNEDLREFNQENINKLLKTKLSEKKLIKPIYLS